MISSSRKIIISGSIIKYPWGGLIQYWLSWLVALKKIGHDVYYVEDEEWEYACYDINKRMMTNDPSYGIGVVKNELERYNMGNRWCYINLKGECFGLNKTELKDLFKTADVFIDMDYDSLKPFSLEVPLRVYIDGEPGWNQIGIKKLLNKGAEIPTYDIYFSLGLNIGPNNPLIPDLNIKWHNLLSPVSLETPYLQELQDDAAFSTIMQWQANPTLEFEGKQYGMKDQEFQKFIELPKYIDQKMEVVASGPNVPRDLLRKNGWIVKNGDDVSTSIDNYRKYISRSKGEFSVVKNVFVETNCGVFMERSGYFMFSKRPVVLQDTGWSAHLPTGRGLFAVNNFDDAIEAINMINSDFKRHSYWANEIVHEYLDSDKIVSQFLQTLELECVN